MRNVSDESCTENQNTHFIFNNFYPNIVQFMGQCEKYGTARQATYDKQYNIRKMRFACQIAKTQIQTHPHNI